MNCSKLASYTQRKWAEEWAYLKVERISKFCYASGKLGHINTSYIVPNTTRHMGEDGQYLYGPRLRTADYEESGMSVIPKGKKISNPSLQNIEEPVRGNQNSVIPNLSPLPANAQTVPAKLTNP